MIWIDSNDNLNKDCQLQDIPHSILLIGDACSGKHDICKSLSNTFGLEYHDITEELSLDLIYEIYTKPSMSLYVIDLDSISVQEQNMILKIVEEPYVNAYICILTRSSQKAIATIKNRCYIHEMKRYSYKELESINTILCKYCTTVNQINKYKDIDIESLIRLCNLIIDKIGTSNYSNILTIADKVDFKSEEPSEKFPISIFVKCLKTEILERLKKSYSDNLHNLFLRTSKFYNDMTFDKRLDCRKLFESYLIDAKAIMR